MKIGLLDFVIQAALNPLSAKYIYGMAVSIVVSFFSCLMFGIGRQYYSQLEEDIDNYDEENVYLQHRFSQNGVLKFRNSGCVFYRNNIAVSKEFDNVESIEFDGTDENRILVVTTPDGVEKVHCGKMSADEFLKIYDLIAEYAGDPEFYKLRRNYG